MAPAPPSAFPRIRDWRDAATILAGTGLLLVFWWLAVSASRENSQTSDELPHIASGYAYNHFGDFRMQPENGNLPQRVFGLPGQLLGAHFPADEARWRRSAYWQLSWDYLYGLDNPANRIVFWARALNALFGVALGAFIFGVAWSWYGRWGGLLAAGLYALCPNFLAHSGLATSDVAATLFLTIAPWFFWRHLERRDVASGLLAGVLGGLALVAKFNGVLLAPIYLVLIVVDGLLADNRGRRLGANLALGSGQVLLGAAVIWMFYDFRYAAAGPGRPPLDSFLWPWAQVLSGVGWKAPIINLARSWHLLPEAWLYGLGTVLAGSVARPSFLAGAYSSTGWWQFFPVLFLLKTPLALLAAVPAFCGLGAIRWHRAPATGCLVMLRRWAPLVATMAVVWLAALASHMNIGHRHILAVYPALFIAAGSLASGPVFVRVLVMVVLLAGQAAESFGIRPDYLAFFNPLGGGPDRAYRIVADSSLDWGQGLPALRKWLATHKGPGEPVYLSYFGSAWAPSYGVRPTHFLPAVNIAVPPWQPYAYEPGLYCLSATSLAEIYAKFQGPWRGEWERQYRAAPHDGAEYDALRFARLCKYLQRRTPDGNAGHSILIYRLTAGDLQAALAGPVVGW